LTTSRNTYDPYAPVDLANVPVHFVGVALDEPAEAVAETEPVFATGAVLEDEVPVGSVNTILDWVGENKNRARRALEAEEAGPARPSAIKKLKAVID
jgi:hypothetical protein